MRITIDEIFAAIIQTPISFGGPYACFSGSIASSAPTYFYLLGSTIQCFRISFRSTMLYMKNAGVNLYKPLYLNTSAVSGIIYCFSSGGVSGGFSTTVVGNMPSRSGSIQTTNGIVSGKVGAFQILSCAGTSRKPTAPTAAGLNMGMDAMADGGINIWSTQVQYIGFISPSLGCRRRVLYEYIVSPATDEFRWYVAANGSIPHMRLMASGLVRNCTAVSKTERINNL